MLTPSPSPGPSGPAIVDTLPGSTIVSTTGLSKPQLSACGGSPQSFCLHVFDVTHSSALAGLSDVILTAYHLLVIVVVALLLRYFVGKLIGRTVRTIQSGRVRSHLGRAASLIETAPEATARRAARAQTVGSVLRSIANITIAALALILVLGELGIDLAPILASAGIAGVAIGFGAQSIVKDFLSGLFLVLEDQYGVGDVITVGTVTGTVEDVGLRSTRVRDVRGTLWHLRNGDVVTVGNISQGWSRTLLDVVLDVEADVALARRVMLDTATALSVSEEWQDEVLEPPAVWGVDEVSLDGITLRLAVRSHPGRKDDLARALREQLLVAFAGAGVPLASSSGITAARIGRLQTKP